MHLAMRGAIEFKITLPDLNTMSCIWHSKVIGN